MARIATPTVRPYANLSAFAAADGHAKLLKRMIEVKNWPDPISSDEAYNTAEAVATKVNATYREIYGPGTVEAEEGMISSSLLTLTSLFLNGPPPLTEYVKAFRSGKTNVLTKLQTTADLLAEIAHPPQSENSAQRVSRAYKALDFHSKISSVSSDLFLDGHYANAVLDAVKALNDLVRSKTLLTDDGETLMNKAFSPKNPLLVFNDLTDRSDEDEQRGFMMMFAGAVAGLRNPRAHKFVNDDPERALEFIAYISLLAKLLDSAKLRQP
jgi:uncharacterized protein (TIGR02391 family)